MDDSIGWGAFERAAIHVPTLGVRLDTSTMRISDEERERLADRLAHALEQMHALEAGAVANPDEGRQVGHYWLRAPGLAPEPKMRDAIDEAVRSVTEFGDAVRGGTVAPHAGGRFRHVLLIGIGGSALGPQFVSEALGSTDDPLDIRFLDNTDPDGIARALDELGDGLSATLGVVVSKSGGTPETRNGLALFRARLERAGLEAPPRLVAVTGGGSALAELADRESWCATFPMWSWVGGRTSQTSAVGLLPMSLLGHDATGLLEGARLMDEATRIRDASVNPAAELALSWHVATGGAGRRDMVVIPYSDRLALFSRYLQQLVMESLGKEKDLEGRIVRQGIAVYGNKGSTDQHAYVQQLRDGIDNFFVTLIGVHEDGGAEAGVPVAEGATAGDFLTGFMLGTRRALVESGRMVQTITIPRVDAIRIGALIALYERAVGLYASLIGINAYHQPGVEAGKKAAADILTLQSRLVAATRDDRGALRTALEWAERVGSPERAVDALIVLEHLAANERADLRREGPPGDPAARFGAR